MARYAPEAAAAWQDRIGRVRLHRMAGIVDMVVERYLRPAVRAARPEAEERVRALVLANDPVAYERSCRAVAGVDWLDRLHEVRCPTLVIAGEHDAGATPQAGREIAERIPDARLEVLADASHLSVQEVPAVFLAAVTAFLRAA